MSKIKLETNNPIAYESLDHIHPWGTRRDNSKNPIFNYKIQKIFKNKFINILDLGCSGGGYVRDCIDEGHLAVGLEGSDYSKQFNRAEWAIIPNSLFTCDITKSFQLFLDKEKLKFDLITAWEVMEHIEEKDFSQLIDNIKKHLKLEGLCIFSICLLDDFIKDADGNTINLHRTVKPKKWWIELFESYGLYHLPQYLSFFNEQYIRGNKYGSRNAIHVILTLDKEKAPEVPKLSFRRKFHDKYWFGTNLQKKLKYLITGSL